MGYAPSVLDLIIGNAHIFLGTFYINVEDDFKK